MNIKRRLSNLECKPHQSRPAPRPKESAYQSALRIIDECRAAELADPEGCERRRQEHLISLGFPPGYRPHWREHLQRLIERQNK